MAQWTRHYRSRARIPSSQWSTVCPAARRPACLRTYAPGAKTWNINPARIGIMGFSAGGHLASTAGTHFDSGDPKADDAVDRVSCRPDFMILVYPVITMGERRTAGSRKNLLGQIRRRNWSSCSRMKSRSLTKRRQRFWPTPWTTSPCRPKTARRSTRPCRRTECRRNTSNCPSGGHGLNGYKGPMWDAWQEQSLAWLAELKTAPRNKVPEN